MGATFPKPIYDNWVSEYGKLNQNVQIDYQSQGSGAGIKGIQAQTVDFGASDAPMSDADLKAAPGEIQADNAGVQLPAEELRVVYRADASGTSAVFTEYLSAIIPEWKADVGADKSPKWPVGQGGKGLSR